VPLEETSSNNGVIRRPRYLKEMSTLTKKSSKSFPLGASFISPCQQCKQFLSYRKLVLVAQAAL
jgi:hypothetical protein